MIPPASPAKASVIPLLKKQGLRDTQPRRMVIDALRRIGRPASPYDIHAWIKTHRGAISPVTVYRILALLETLHLVHRHPENGGYFLCSMPEKRGHHGFMQCIRCGRILEFCSDELRTAETALAKRMGFTPISFITGMLGTCTSCAA